MAASSVRSPTRRILGIFLFLLLVFIQMSTLLVFYAGAFMQSNEVVTSPIDFDDRFEQPCMEYRWSFRSGFYSVMSAFQPLVILCLYVPLVLVPFALLAMLLAAYAKDRATLRVSLACQGASSSLNLAGLILFLLLNLSYVSRKDLTLCFYAYVSVPIELAITTLLTATVSERNLPSDWE